MAELSYDLERTEVYLVGDVPSSIATELSHRSMVPKFLGAQEELTREMSALKGVIIQYRPVSRQYWARYLSRMVVQVQDWGGFVILVAESTLTTAARAEVLALAGTYSAVRVLVGREAYEVAEECARHVPGREANDDQSCEVIDASDVGDSARTLLSRAFNDANRITVESLPGGQSKGATVWKVVSHCEGRGSPAPYAVKCGDIDRISAEIASMRDFVDDYIPFVYRAPVLMDRCVSGAWKRLLVTQFVERATRLDSYLEAKRPVMAVSAIFDGPLRTWRRTGNREQLTTVKLHDVYTKEDQLIPSPEGLKDAYSCASATYGDVTEPSGLLSDMAACRQENVEFAMSHGDLHAKNIFILENTMQAVLIDFAHAKRRPLSFDPASLEAAIALGVTGELESLDTLYSPPLLAAGRTVNEEDVRFEAVRRIRREAALDCSSEEYDFTVACEFLWLSTVLVAREPTKAAKAYQLACRIIRHLKGVSVVENALQ